MTYLEAFHKYILKPLKMNNTNVGDTNIKLYLEDGKKLTKEQYIERYIASSAGGLYSCVNDFINFSNIIKLLDKNSINILQKLYIYKFKNDEHIIKHEGGIYGGKSKFIFKYNKE